MLSLPPALLHAIQAHSEAAYPNEGAGLLLGQANGAHKALTAILPIANQWEADEQYHRFLITPDDMRRVIGLLKATFTHLIIDLSKSYSPIDLVAMEMANHVLLVTQLDLPCLRNIVRLMMSFGQMDAIKDKVKIVVNRVGLDSHIGLKKAQETIGRDIFWQLPNDYRTMVEVRNKLVESYQELMRMQV